MGRRQGRVQGRSGVLHLIIDSASIHPERERGRSDSSDYDPRPLVPGLLGRCRRRSRGSCRNIFFAASHSMRCDPCCLTQKSPALRGLIAQRPATEGSEVECHVRCGGWVLSTAIRDYAPQLIRDHKYEHLLMTPCTHGQDGEFFCLQPKPEVVGVCGDSSTLG